MSTSTTTLRSVSSDSLRAIPWVLRAGVAGCFIGHGAFGVITKAAWVPYFGVAGISEAHAWKLMPIVGWIDIAIGILALLWPCRFLFGWAAGWAIWTALLRPFSGESFWEAIERAGNYGVPIAILVAVSVSGPWFVRLPAIWPSLTNSANQGFSWALRLTTAALLFGHGSLGFFVHKAGLAKHYAAAGVTNPTGFISIVGGIELLLAVLVLLLPHPALLVFICVWKLASESLFIVAGSPFWEIIERFGSYTAPLALALILLSRSRSSAASPPWSAFVPTSSSPL